MIDKLTRPVDVVGLKGRRRIGDIERTIDEKPVERAGFDSPYMT